jgi:hypothetical protein
MGSCIAIVEPTAKKFSDEVVAECDLTEAKRDRTQSRTSKQIDA